jgi:hypothetical protein
MREFNTRAAEGNYSITFETDDRKAFEQVQTLCRILIDGKDGEFIPKEWIEKWIAYWTRILPDWGAFEVCAAMLKDWEKENESRVEQ